MIENNKAWDEIPLHLAKLKKEHPDEPINPNLPPLHSLVEAIRFLKQEDLPGSLLGEWQFPLPHVEVLSPKLLSVLPLYSRSKPCLYWCDDIRHCRLNPQATLTISRHFSRSSSRQRESLRRFTQKNPSPFRMLSTKNHRTTSSRISGTLTVACPSRREGIISYQTLTFAMRVQRPFTILGEPWPLAMMMIREQNSQQRQPTPSPLRA
jgi:hypothetical protein